MSHIVAWMFLGVVVCLTVFCVYEWNEMRKCAKRYAEARSRFDAMIYKEAQDCIKRLEEMNETGT